MCPIILIQIALCCLHPGERFTFPEFSYKFYETFFADSRTQATILEGGFWHARLYINTFKESEFLQIICVWKIVLRTRTNRFEYSHKLQILLIHQTLMKSHINLKRFSTHLKRIWISEQIYAINETLLFWFLNSITSMWGLRPFGGFCLKHPYFTSSVQKVFASSFGINVHISVILY